MLGKPLEIKSGSPLFTSKPLSEKKDYKDMLLTTEKEDDPLSTPSRAVRRALTLVRFLALSGFLAKSIEAEHWSTKDLFVQGEV